MLFNLVTRLAQQLHAQLLLRRDKVPASLAALTVAAKFTAMSLSQISQDSIVNWPTVASF
jgi:hypothetical protein